MQRFNSIHTVSIHVRPASHSQAEFEPEKAADELAEDPTLTIGTLKPTPTSSERGLRQGALHTAQLRNL
ncbi:hypothetical protein VTI28DRAFT_10269 [Corynascus sepedonium]